MFCRFVRSLGVALLSLSSVSLAATHIDNGAYLSSLSINQNNNELDRAISHLSPITTYYEQMMRSYLSGNTEPDTKKLIRNANNSAQTSQQNNALDPLGPGPVAFVQPPHQASLGAIAATYDVGTDGNASYIIPISAPAGLGGIQPNISLAYK